MTFFHVMGVEGKWSNFNAESLRAGPDFGISMVATCLATVFLQKASKILSKMFSVSYYIKLVM